jgi:hypothetical protein
VDGNIGLALGENAVYAAQLARPATLDIAPHSRLADMRDRGYPNTDFGRWGENKQKAAVSFGEISSAIIAGSTRKTNHPLRQRLRFWLQCVCARALLPFG